MKRALSIVVLVVAAVATSPTNEASGSGPAAYYDPSYTYGEWLRIFNLHVGWGNAIPGAVPSASGYWCVHPDHRVGETLQVSANGTSIVCTVGDSVQPHHVASWRAKWVIELSYNAFVALGLTTRNVVDSVVPTTNTYVVEEPAREQHSVVYFDETGYVIGHGFLEFWNDNGGLAIFGYPLSNETKEGGLVVQYFERAVFEYYPENDPENRVLLRRIGAEVLGVD